jgi:hypothetical protein
LWCVAPLLLCFPCATPTYATTTCAAPTCAACAWLMCFSSVSCYPVTFVRPLGTPRPACSHPCNRQHTCVHPVRHTCHDEERCPPCVELVPKPCWGGHTVLPNIRYATGTHLVVALCVCVCVCVCVRARACARVTWRRVWRPSFCVAVIALREKCTPHISNA